MNNSTRISVLRPYLIYVILFVGAGMVSGGVVHYPLNENFYGTLAIFGGVVFALGSVASEFLSGNGLPKFPALVRLIAVSLMLSFGIGMLSGGIQHFTDFPTRAAILIPAGITLSFFAYCLKAKLFRREALKKVSIAGLLVLSVAGTSLFTLTNVAEGMKVEEHTHSVSTSDAATTTEEDHTNHPHNE